MRGEWSLWMRGARSPLPRRTGTLIAIGLTLCAVLGGSPPAMAAAASHGAVGPAVTATDTLALDLLADLDPGANAVTSPVSIETAVAMVDQGAGAGAAAQLDEALGGAASPAALAQANRALALALHTAVTGYGPGGPTLTSANGLWVQSGLRLDRPFSQTLASDFGAAAQATDFAGDPDGAVAAINAWVSARTDGLIQDLVNDSIVNSSTALFLANAVYLHANWTQPFNAADTQPAAFASPAGPVQVPFMSQSASHPYAATARYSAVALSYAHSSLQYLAVMPPDGQIASLQRWLTVSRLNTLVASLRSHPLALSMPKFTLSLDTSLDGFLQGLGIRDIFSAGGLTRLVAGQPLGVSDVVHDATLEVAERGTVAAAATGVGITSTAAPVREGLTVDLNHPFLVFIRDVRTGAILFTARVMDPSSSS